MFFLFQILLDASDGASDYGNKFGEPLIQGYTRTFGMRLPNGERREWLKPIMFSAGIGQIDHRHLEKGESDLGMLVVKVCLLPRSQSVSFFRILGKTLKSPLKP
jgi:phosphoribosylformylglycinamidine synthase